MAKVKLTRIAAAISGALKTEKAKRKVDKMKRSIKNAYDNATDTYEDLEDSLTKELAKLSDTEDVNTVITKLSDIKGKMEEQEAIKARLKWIETYIEEEIEVDEPENKD